MIRSVRKGIKKSWATATLLSLELLAVVAIFFIALFAFVMTARMVFLTKNSWFDTNAFRFLADHVNDVNTNIMQGFSFLGTHYFLIPANLLLIGYFLIKKHRWYSIKFPVIALGSLLLMFLLKTFFGRQRPLVPLLSEARGLSFPSGHAMMSLSFYGLLIIMTYKSNLAPAVKWLLIAMLGLCIVFIGISRVYLRVHYASDVLAGFTLGLMWLILSVFILDKIENISKKQIKVVGEPQPGLVP
ncbi:MAG: phosphatase PAP2 family protein [Chitinophagaceae bacterium]|nr:phosphatase PAP2 family protein [Chitinophagaceae bacterium]